VDHAGNGNSVEIEFGVVVVMSRLIDRVPLMRMGPKRGTRISARRRY